MKATPIIPWLGGKRRLAKHILPLFPEHECYVEPFCGGAALFFMKEPATTEVLNDINGDLVRLYRVVRYHLDEFIKQFRWALVSREMFKWTKDTPPESMTDIQRAARFYYLMRTGFGARLRSPTFGTTTTSGPKLNLVRIEEDLSMAHIRLARAYIENLPWQDCVSRYDRPHTLFYMDPPYWGTEGYDVDFGLDQYDRMAELAKSVAGKVIISVNDIPEMWAAFKGLRIIDKIGTRYQVGGMKRDKEARELLILNF